MVVNHKFLPQGRKVNKEYYLEVMRRLRKTIRQKRTELWKYQSWILHHDNAPAHTSMLVNGFLAKNKTAIMPQSPYSQDLATDERKAFCYNGGDRRKIKIVAVSDTKKRVSKVFRGLEKTLA